MSIDAFVNEYLIREWYYAETIEIPAPRKDFRRHKDELSFGLWGEEIERNGKGFVRASWGHNLMTGFACVFLTKNNKCSIHNSKPSECRESFGCKDSDGINRQDIENYWKKHQGWVTEIGKNK